MTVQTSTPLPTAEHLDASRKALSESYNRLEEIEMLLSRAHEAAFDNDDAVDFHDRRRDDRQAVPLPERRRHRG
jgi:hypothetical protein